MLFEQITTGGCRSYLIGCDATRSAALIDPELSQIVPVVMHRLSPAPFVDMRINDGEMIVLGKLRIGALHTPGHTADSMCLQVDDRVFTGDTLLIGFSNAVALDGGMKAWREAGYPTREGAEP